jgi:hypothetical protein
VWIVREIKKPHFLIGSQVSAQSLVKEIPQLPQRIPYIMMFYHHIARNGDETFHSRVV